MQIINLPPIAPTLIESTRAIGYSLEAAVADIIDNSIAADASKIDISFFPLHGAYISIFDNGNGMSSEELTRAMQYGSQNPNDVRGEKDLGRFGLGLKTASLSQCRKLTVVAKKNGMISARKWDIDFVQTTRQWSLISLEDDEIADVPDIDRILTNDHGTLVVWEDLDRMEEGTIDFTKSMGKQIDLVRDHLSLVFHRYLAGETGLKKLDIEINGTKIFGVDPFLTKKSDQTMQEESYVIHGSVIKVQPFILPHISKMTTEDIAEAGGKDGLRKLQGFYVYRNKRLLVWGTWFRMMRKGELSKLARIRVDIPNSLDNLWTLDIKKSSAMPPEEVRVNLVNIIDKIGSKSKLKFTHRGRLEVDENEIHVWNRLRSRDGGFYYEINREHPLVSQLKSLCHENEKAVDTVLAQIEKSIPLNQLYVDLNSDEQIKNEKNPDNKEIAKAIKDMLDGFDTNRQKTEFLDQLKDTLPFKNYPKVIDAIEKELGNDE